MPLDPPASDDPATMSVDLEMYLIPRNEPVVRVLTASSTPRVSSIAGAPGDRNHGRSSLTSDGHHRGDPLEALEAGTHSPGSPGRPPGASGDARGNRPSKPTAAGPSAGSSASATRPLRSSSATVSSSTAEGREKEGSGPPSSSGRDGGSQPPPSVGEVSSRSARRVSGAPPRGVSGAPPRGVSGTPRQEVSSQPAPVVSGSNAGQHTREPLSPLDLSASASPLQPEESPARRSGRSSAARRIQHSEPESPSDPGSDPAGSLDSSFSDNNATGPPPSAPEGRHRCPHPLCDKRYQCKKDAVKHVNDVHKESFPLPNGFARCPDRDCRKVFTRGGLTNHIRRKHPNLLPADSALDGDHLAPRPLPQAPPLPPAPEASLEDIHQFYRSELTWISSSWNPHLLTLHLRLTAGLISTDAAHADHCLSAYLLLPGFLEAVRAAARLPGAKQLKIEAPITYLRLFTSEGYSAHPEEIIITTVKQMLFKVRRSLSSRLPNSIPRHSQQCRKIDALTKAGRISKAARLADLLEQERNQEDDARPIQGRITREQALAVLSDLFPEANDLDDLGEDLALRDPLQLTSLDVDAAIKKLNIDRAAGFSGWSNRLLKHLYLQASQEDRHQLATNYANFFNKQLKGELSAHMRKYLAPVRLCLIPKTKNPSDLKFRPIGVGEVLFRLLGRAILSKVGKEIGGQIAPLQLAVGVSGGVEIAASVAGLLSAINDHQPLEEPDFSTMSLDVSNAFNNIRRSHILTGLDLRCPGLIPYFNLIYGTKVDLRWNDGSIIGTASTGVLQGDPLSTLFFAIGIQPLLCRLKSKLIDIEDSNDIPPYAKRGIIVAIADDITIHGRTPDLFQLSSMLKTLFDSHQLPLNIDKSWILGPRVFSQAGHSAIPCRRLLDGGKVLGVPIGDQSSCMTWLEKHFADNAPPERILGTLHAKTAVTLLKYSYNARMQYLRKTLPEPLVATAIFSQFDDKIDDALLTTGIADDRATLQILRSLPLDKGGLGMPFLNGHHGKRQHLITSMRTKEYLKSFYPSLVPDHTVLFNSQDIDLDGTPPDDLSDFILHFRARAPAEEDPLSIFIKACRQQSDGIDSSVSSAFHQQLLAADRLEEAAKFLSLQGVKQTFTVYPNGPRVSSETYLSHRVYVAAMRSNLLAPLRRGMGGEAICRCRSEPGVDLCIHPHHPSNCSLNGKERTFRHSEGCRLLVKLIHKACPNARVTLEPRDAGTRYPDIAVVEDSETYHIDVSIVEPTSRHAISSTQSSARTKGAAASFMERTKDNTYANTEWRDTVPFVLESTGLMGKRAEGLLEYITRDCPHLMSFFKGELSLLLARSEGKMRLHTQSLLL